MTEAITPEHLLTLAEQLTPADQEWLLEQLSRLVDQNKADPVEEYEPTLTPAEAEKQFLAEVAAFERLKPALLKTHRGQVVAIYQEQVAVVGQTRTEVLRKMRERFGNVPYYVEWVEENVPRHVRITSVWRAR